MTQTLDGSVIRRPQPTAAVLQDLCLDKGYDYPEIEEVVCARRYIPHIHLRGEQVPQRWRHQAKRWVVERTGAWYSRFCKLLIRFEK